MNKRKTLQELTIKDDFMFGAVMQVEENCKAFLDFRKPSSFLSVTMILSEKDSIATHSETYARKLPHWR